MIWGCLLTMDVQFMNLVGLVEGILDLITGQTLHLFPVQALVNPHQFHGGVLVLQVVILHLVVLQDVVNVPFEAHLLRV